MRGIVLTDEAVADLRAVKRYSIRTWGRAVAEDYMTSLAAGIHRLRTRPASGRQRADLIGAPHAVLVGRHIVLYDYEDADVQVLAVRHERRDIRPWQLTAG